MNIDSLATNPSLTLIPKEIHTATSLDWTLQSDNVSNSAVASVKVHQSLKESFISSEDSKNSGPDLEFLQQANLLF